MIHLHQCLGPYEWICAQNGYNFIAKEHCWPKYLKIQRGKVGGKVEDRTTSLLLIPKSLNA
jgi:hypothetical protein